MTWLKAAALGLALLLAPGCAAPADETVAGESTTPTPAAAAGAPTADGWLAALGATGIGEKAAAAPTAAKGGPPVGRPDDGAAATGVGTQLLAEVHRVGESATLGEMVVTLVEAARTESGARARFAIENRGGAPAVLSPGNYRLRTDGARPRMRLQEPGLPVGTVQPGQALRGDVAWELADGSAVSVLFVSGGDSVEWVLAG
jgi:hypothetical protein